MALTPAQKQLLAKYKLSLHTQEHIEKSLNETGRPIDINHPDFLIVVGNLVHDLEKKLDEKRRLLKDAQLIEERSLQPQSLAQIASSGIRETENIAHLQEVVLLRAKAYMNKIEEELKNYWDEGAALWAITDAIIRSPAIYEVALTAHHVKQFLGKENLAVVEMIKWAHPEFFDIKVAFLQKFLSGGLAFILGTLLGFFGGLKGGAELGYERVNVTPTPNFFTTLKALSASLLFGVMGCLTGAATGATTALEVGYRTGNPIVGARLGLFASITNPFHAPPGLKNNQLVKLKIEETLFNAANSSRRFMTRRPI